VVVAGLALCDFLFFGGGLAASAFWSLAGSAGCPLQSLLSELLFLSCGSLTEAAAAFR